MNPRVEAAHQLTLREILAIEDDAAFLEFRCERTGIPLWPSARMLFLRIIMSDLLYGVPLAGPGMAQPHRAPAVARLFRASAHNALRWPQGTRDLVVMSSGAGNVRVGGKWLNRLGDYFVQAAGANAAIVEEYSASCWPFPRYTHDMLFHQPLRLRSIVAERVLPWFSPSAAAVRLIDLARARAKEVLDWDVGDARAAWLTKALQRRVAALPSLLGAYESLLARLQPKLLLIEEGCYGGYLTALIAAAREAGVVTAEYQHGAISAGHDAYNVAPALAASSEYRRTLPDHFLGYGTWWNEQINVPVEKHAIGNPHRSETLGSFRTDGKRTDIVILGDHIETDLYLDLARALAVRVGRDYRIVFRPHPLVREAVERRYPDGSAPGGVVIDPEADIYKSFATAEIAVSEVSTGLFEAIGLVPRIFIWDTAKARFGYPSHPFQRFLTGEELAEMVRDPACGRVPESDVDSIWAPGWKENYRAFVRGVLRR